MHPVEIAQGRAIGPAVVWSYLAGFYPYRFAHIELVAEVREGVHVDAVATFRGLRSNAPIDRLIVGDGFLPAGACQSSVEILSGAGAVDSWGYRERHILKFKPLEMGPIDFRVRYRLEPAASRGLVTIPVFHLVEVVAVAVHSDRPLDWIGAVCGTGALSPMSWAIDRDAAARRDQLPRIASAHRVEVTRDSYRVEATQPIPCHLGVAWGTSDAE